MSNHAFIALGSNIGDKTGNCTRAISLISKHEDCIVLRVSSFYETEPWGVVEQDKFINMAVEIETALSPFELLEFLKSLEIEMGRTKAERWGPRLIDLDIIFYNDKIIDEKGLNVPHPHMHERAFVLAPLSEIAPDLIHPLLGKSISELFKSVDSSGVKKITQ